VVNSSVKNSFLFFSFFFLFLWTRKDHTKKRTPKTHSSRLCVLLGVAHKKRTHSLYTSRRRVVLAQHERTTVLFRAPFITALSRGEREREREGGREKRFESSYFILFVVGVLNKVCVFYRDPSFGPEKKKTHKKNLFPNNERPKMHRHHQPVVARLSLLPLSREESSPINKRMKKKRGVICLG
jgi:hypothetical protein